MNEIRTIKDKALTGTAGVKATLGMLYGAVLTAGSDTAMIILYDDDDDATGTILLKLSATANTTAQAVLHNPIPFSVGCYAAMTGTSPAAYVLYE